MFLTRNEQVDSGGWGQSSEAKPVNSSTSFSLKEYSSFTIYYVLSGAITSLVFEENGFNASRLRELSDPVPLVASLSHSLGPLGVRGSSGSNPLLFFRDSFD